MTVFGCGNNNNKHGIDRLKWLCGTWHLYDENGNYFEQWKMSDDGSGIEGMAFNLVERDTIVDEYLSVKTINNTMYYTAISPENSDSVRFKLVSLKPNYAVFENLKNPYPTRIMYTFNEPGFLYTRLEGWQMNEQKIKEYFLQKVR